MMIKWMTQIWVCFSLLMLVVSCGNYQSAPVDAMASGQYARMESNDVGNPQVEEDKRMMVYQMQIHLVVPSLEKAQVEMKGIAERFDGYLETEGTSHLVLRIPASKLDDAGAEVEKKGKVKYKNKSARDISLQFKDFQIRLNNAEQARNRYLELLAKAETVEAALLVEKELERLNGEIDRLKAWIKSSDNKVDYATLVVNLTEKKKLGPLGYVTVGLYEAVKWLFVRN